MAYHFIWDCLFNVRGILKFLDLYAFALSTGTWEQLLNLIRYHISLVQINLVCCHYTPDGEASDFYIELPPNRFFAIYTTRFEDVEALAKLKQAIKCLAARLLEF